MAEETKTSRRGFLIGLVAGSVFTASVSVASNALLPPKPREEVTIYAHKSLRPKYALLIHSDLCAGCRRCMLACTLYHEGFEQIPLSRIHVQKDILTGDFQQNKCYQCFLPFCMLSCPYEAIEFNPETGAKIVNPEKCVGEPEQFCVHACKLGMVSFDGVAKKSS